MHLQMRAWSISLARRQRYVLHDIVVVARAIENEFGNLGLAEPVCSVDHHGILTALGRQFETPRSECEPAEIHAELCGGPGLAAVEGYIDGTDAVAAVPSLAANRDLARLDLVAVPMAGDERVHDHLGDGCSRCVFLA